MIKKVTVILVQKEIQHSHIVTDLQDETSIKVFGNGQEEIIITSKHIRPGTRPAAQYFKILGIYLTEIFNK